VTARIRFDVAAILALCLSVGACRHAPDIRPEPLPHEPEPAMELEQRYAWLSGFFYDGKRVQEIVDALRFDSISLERGPCYGACPVYRVVLRRDLSAVYHGEQFVERQGAWHGGVSLFAYGRLSYLIERWGVMAMDSSYTRDVTDQATATLRVWSRGSATPKVISDYADAGPVELWGVEHIIDGLADRTQWTRSRPDP